MLRQLRMPVPGQKPTPERQAEDAASFLAFAGAFGVTPPKSLGPSAKMAEESDPKE